MSGMGARVLRHRAEGGPGGPGLQTLDVLLHKGFVSGDDPRVEKLIVAVQERPEESKSQTSIMGTNH